ncbi:MAG: DNA polymerase I [Ignavibacteria bacterium]|nr:DNA polymerase I [Ignavibacteria bacterium]
MQKKKLVLIDAMALAYKAYFAFSSRPLITKNGEPTSAVYGFITQLIKIIEDIKPDYIAVASDSKEKTFRHERYDKYKSNRAEMPDDMIPQIKRIYEIIAAFNIPLYMLPGYEADDIIGTASVIADNLDIETLMITPDKDYIQLITDNVRLIKPGKSGDELNLIDKEKVLQDFGFDPPSMIDYLALIGDSSDAIPGVKGIGPKSALPLIQKYGTIENIYEHIEEIDSKSTKTKLEISRNDAFLSKELATILKSVPLEIDIPSTKRVKPNFDLLQNIFTELEFKSLFNRVQNALRTSETEPVQPLISEELSKFDNSKVNYSLIVETESAKILASKLLSSDLFVFDTETDSLDHFTLNLAGASFAVKSGEAYFIAINPQKTKKDFFTKEVSDRLPINDFIQIFKPVFENENIKKVCQNGKFDISVLRSIGIEVKNFYFDTMVASYVIDPDQRHGMDDLSEKYLNYKPIPLTDLIGLKKNPEIIFEANVNSLSDYSCEDADITYRLYEMLSNQIEKDNLHNVAFNIEFPLIEVLEDMERIGIRVDKKMLNALSKDLESMMDEYARNIFSHSGETFNINSPNQMQKILYDKLGLKTGKKTKTGFSTDARALESLRGEHPIIDAILDYRQVTKLKSTYADALPALIHPLTGRVHTSYNQTVASTGRLSSNNPNLQNIPIRTELGKEIRKAFVATDNNHLILSADYSQIELRIMASMCNDEAMTKAFINKEDIHRATAALVFGVSPEDVTSDMRRKAKEVNFGILYGIGAFGLKTRLGILQSHAKEIIDNYFMTFKNVKAFMDSIIVSTREKGYAETLTGRRRYLRNINSSNFVVKQFEERAAINMPIQGTAADMIKVAMINIYSELNKSKLKTKMILQVHDELVFDVPKEELADVQPMIKSLMENAFPLNVPVIADTGVGDNWLDAH